MKRQIVTATLIASFIYLSISASIENGLLLKAIEYGRAKRWLAAESDDGSRQWSVERGERASFRHRCGGRKGFAHRQA